MRIEPPTPALRTVWAKSGSAEEGTWLPLWVHLADTVNAADALWDRWIASSTKRVLAADIGSEVEAKSLYLFLCGIHDVGKASPPFVLMDPGLTEKMTEAGFTIGHPDVMSAASATTRHEVFSQLALETWLHDEMKWNVKDVDRLAMILGGHHGVIPDRAVVKQAVKYAGNAGFAQARHDLITWMADATGVRPLLAPNGPVSALSRRSQLLLLGDLVVADWRASYLAAFPPISRDSDGSDLDIDRRGRRAWARYSMPPTWVLRDRGATASDYLNSRVRNLSDPEYTAFAMQDAVLDAARHGDPGLLIITAPMGDGKTEASLMAAEVFAARTGAAGIFYALPTMATANRTFHRVRSWVDRSGPGAPVATFLAHSKRDLNPENRELRSMVFDREIAARAMTHPWMSTATKGALADLVVGTIDQVLAAALRSKHSALRMLALQRKVVVLDEIHSYDAAMNTFLTLTLKWLGQLGVPVIAMSATLTPTQRNRLMDAYDAGRRGTEQHYRAAKLPDDPSASMITYRRKGRTVHRSVAGSPRRQDVHVVLRGCETHDIAGILAEELADGGTAAVIRNTVKSAQETYRALKSIFGQDVVLLHSRYLGPDRQRLEDRVTGEIGKDHSVWQRPRRRIVVSTQVLEQSLDLDFDVMLTDLAPLDLVLQRAGRLHRHDNQRPERLNEAKLYVLADWQSTPPVPPRGSEYVYHLYPLLRSAAILLDLPDDTLRLPDDIPRLVAAAYEDDGTFHETWSDAMAAARKEYDDAIHLAEANATVNLSMPALDQKDCTGRTVHYTDLGGFDDRVKGVVDPERGDSARASVRNGDDSIQAVLLVDGVLPTWAASSQYAPDEFEFSRTPSEEALQTAQECMVPLPVWVSERVGEALLHQWKDGSSGRGRYASKVAVIRGTSAGPQRVRASLDGVISMKYDPEYGLRCEETR